MLTRCVVFLMFTLLPAAASAQATDRAPRVSIGAGAGLALPFHGDLDFTPWAWEADLRVGLSARTILEVAGGEWRHSAARVVENIQVTPPPGTIGRFGQRTTRTQRMLQVNVLFSATAGAVRLAAGGGVGVLQLERRTRTETSGCSPEVSCGTSESAFTTSAGTAQATGGFEVPLARGLNAYGQARFIVNTRDVGGSESRFTAGLRWGFGG